MILAILLTLIALFALWRLRMSFNSQNPVEYAGTGPGFDITTRFSGPISCEGMVFGPTGRMASRFVADMEGSWNGSQGRLKECFTYATGARQTREWHLTMGENGHFTATADDVIGVAVAINPAQPCV